MMICNDHKIFQTLPGQGWRVLIDWQPDESDVKDGFPRFTEEPVVMFVTAKVSRSTANPKHEYEQVIISPLVRYPDGQTLSLLDDVSLAKWLYLAPGEEAADHIDRLLSGDYIQGVSLDAGETGSAA